MTNPKNSGKRRQWRVKTTEAFQDAYGTEDNRREEIIVAFDQDVDLSAGDDDSGSLTPYVNGSSQFWYEVTGDRELHFIGLGRSHWESYEAITDDKNEDEEIR